MTSFISKASPVAAGAMAADLGLTCDLYQPFRDFEGAPDAAFRRSLDRAERKFDVMQAVGAELMLVCSNTSVDVVADEERAAAQLYELAERAAKRNLRIGYEALAWGRVVNLYGQAWSIVNRANHSHLGLILDSFHTLSLRDDPAGIARIPGEKIFFVQFADAHLMDMNVLQWARHFRSFPGQGQFDLVNFFAQVLLAGYTGPLSLEIFNDIFRETPNRRTAKDAMRSLLYLESQVRSRLNLAAKAGRRIRGGERAGARADRIVPSAGSDEAHRYCVSRVRRRRRVGSDSWCIAQAAGVPPRRKASQQGHQPVPPGEYQSDPERGSALVCTRRILTNTARRFARSALPPTTRSAR